MLVYHCDVFPSTSLLYYTQTMTAGDGNPVAEFCVSERSVPLWILRVPPLVGTRGSSIMPGAALSLPCLYSQEFFSPSSLDSNAAEAVAPHASSPPPPCVVFASVGECWGIAPPACHWCCGYLCFCTFCIGPVRRLAIHTTAFSR